MSWFYRTFVRPILFARDSEQIHDRTMRALAFASRRDVLTDALASLYGAPDLPVRVFGLDFPNPVGLAAGMDKHGVAVPAWESLGFGFCELGGVTRHPQPGNPPPRMFRAVPDEALINRMGFNNPGADAVAETLAEWRKTNRWPRHPVGMNLGKSKNTPLDQAADDYVYSFKALRSLCDFFVVNVSSPNTPNLRQLQDKTALDEILAALQEANFANAESPARPLLVKVAPDLVFDALDDIVGLVQQRKLAGIVATNTTIARPDAAASELQRIYQEPGGLSGRPLRARSTEIIRHLYRQTGGVVPLIGVGGIFNGDDAWEKIRAGASLIQTYTGLVYEGPGITREIVSGLREHLAERGWTELRQAVGCAAGVMPAKMSCD